MHISLFEDVSHMILAKVEFTLKHFATVWYLNSCLLSRRCELAYLIFVYEDKPQGY